MDWPKWKDRLKKAGIYAIATGGFVGYFPFAPGTVGTLVGVGIVWLFRDTPFWALLSAAVLLTALGVWAAGQASTLWRVHDSGHIVIDEIVGLMFTMVGIPITGYWLVWGFILFRFLDVVKLPPANYFDEKVKNGWGVVMDDVAAGIYGNIVLHLMLRAQV